MPLRAPAGLVVLSEDPIAVSPDRIAGLDVLATIVAGQCRYDVGALDGLSSRAPELGPTLPLRH